MTSSDPEVMGVGAVGLQGRGRRLPERGAAGRLGSEGPVRAPSRCPCVACLVASPLVAASWDGGGLADEYRGKLTVKA